MRQQLAARQIFTLAIAMVCFGLAALRPVSSRAQTLPKVGDQASGFTTQSLSGEEFSFDPKSTKEATVLVFIRGYPGYQCPICTRQVGQLASKSAEFAKAGARVLFVYPGPAAGLLGKAKAFKGSKGLPENFQMVLDGDYKIVNAYNLRWDAKNETAYPSTFVVDQTGTIRYAKISKTHGDRADSAEVLAAVKQLKGLK